MYFVEIYMYVRVIADDIYEVAFVYILLDQMAMLE